MDHVADHVQGFVAVHGRTLTRVPVLEWAPQKGADAMRCAPSLAPSFAPALALALVFAALPASGGERPHGHGGRHRAGSALGTAHFATSCDGAVAAEFDRAVALLHSYEYDEARDAFVSVARRDPNCAMAKWGEAM